MDCSDSLRGGSATLTIRTHTDRGVVPGRKQTAGGDVGMEAECANTVGAHHNDSESPP